MLADVLGSVGAQQSGESLTEWAEKSMKEVGDKHPMKEGDWIRASGLGWMCAREEVLCAQHGVVRKASTSASTAWVFSVGHGIHWVMQNLVLGPRKMISGSWKCNDCATVVGGAQDNSLVVWPDECPSCKKAPVDGWTYVELKLKDFELKLSGHADGFHPNGEDLWEFKSANSWSMKSIKNGKIWPAYIDQADVYMMLTGRKRQRMVFIDKGAGSLKSAWHEVVIERSKKRTSAILKKIAQLRNGLAGGKLPDRICANAGCDRAKTCSVVGPCFG